MVHALLDYADFPTASASSQGHDGHLPRVPDVVPLASSKVKDMRSSQLDCPPMTDEVAEPICETPRMRHIQQVPDKDRSNFTGAVYPALVWLHRFRALARAQPVHFQSSRAVCAGSGAWENTFAGCGGSGHQHCRSAICAHILP